MKKTDSFLSLYREAEDLISVRFPASGGDTSPMHWLGKNVTDNGFRKSLRAAREVRNLLSHNSFFENEGVVEPGDKLMSFMVRLRDRLLDEPTAEDLMTPLSSLVSAEPDMSVLDAVDLMLSTGHGVIPVLEDGRLFSAFSERNAMAALRAGDGEMTFREMGEAGGDVRFASRYEHADTIASLLLGIKVIFITEHGWPSERLLGLVTERDMILSIDRMAF